MRTRKLHLVDDDTVSALSERCKGKTRRAVAIELGLEEKDAAMLSDVLKHKPGALSVAGEADLRQRLGLPAIAAYTVTACPTCGGDHGLRGIPDCHGAPVAAVVTLAPGQRVARQRQPAAPRTLSDYPVSMLAQMIERREAYTHIHI